MASGEWMHPWGLGFFHIYICRYRFTFPDHIRHHSWGTRCAVAFKYVEVVYCTMACAFQSWQISRREKKGLMTDKGNKLHAYVCVCIYIKLFCTSKYNSVSYLFFPETWYLCRFFQTAVFTGCQSVGSDVQLSRNAMLFWPLQKVAGEYTLPYAASIKSHLPTSFSTHQYTELRGLTYCPHNKCRHTASSGKWAWKLQWWDKQWGYVRKSDFCTE